MNFKNILSLRFSSLKKFIYKNFFFLRDRYYLFAYLAQGLKNGGTTKELLQSIAFEYDRSNKETLRDMVEATLNHMELDGMTDADAMYHAGLISFMELQAIQTISKSEPHKAMLFINEKTKNNNNLKWAVGMLFFPPLIVILGYLIFQPELKNMTLFLLAPINQISTEPIEIPNYFNSRLFFGVTLSIFLFAMFSLFYTIEYLKKNNIKLLFKIFRIMEREFVVNNFEVFLSLLRAGLSPMKAVELLSENNNDIVSQKIFQDIKIAISEGEKTIYEVLSDYGLDSATISYVRSGEMNNYLIESISMALDYNKDRYEKLIKVLSKILPLTGEILMTIILLKPLLDIINVTTVGSLQFKI